MLGTRELSDGTQLVHMRNPWGTELYTGDWSDESELWNDQLKAEAYWEDLDDGMFYMSLDDYKREFAYTGLNFPTEQMFRAHFMVEDDPVVTGGKWSWCGPRCTRHELEIFSPVDQTLYISSHTWPG